MHFLVLCALLFLPVTLHAQCTLSISNPPNFQEGTGGTTIVTFDVSKAGSGACSALFSTTVFLPTAGGSNCNGTADFISQVDQSIAISATQNTAQIRVTLCGDNRDEDNEDFGVLLHHPATGTTISSAALARVTIFDDDPPPDIRINDANINEGNSNHDGTFIVSLSAPSSFPISVNFDTVSNTANRGDACGGSVDFVRRNSSLTLFPGQTSFELLVPVCGDSSVEQNETFTVVLLPPLNTRVNVVDNQGRGTILDDDLPTVTALSKSQNEGNSGMTSVSITVTLAAPNVNGASLDCTPQQVGVSLNVKPAVGGSSCTSGTDFITQPSRVTFGPTEKTKTCTVNLCGDTVRESDETFIVTLQNIQGAKPGLGTPTVVVKNDD